MALFSQMTGNNLVHTDRHSQVREGVHGQPTNDDSAVYLLADEACDVVEFERLGSQHALLVVLAPGVEVLAEFKELLQDLACILVAPYAAIGVEENLAPMEQ